MSKEGRRSTTMGSFLSSLKVLLPLSVVLCGPRLAAGQAECQPGGAFYFGGEGRNDAIDWSLVTKDYYEGPAPGFPRWYAKMQLTQTDLWQRNPYIDSITFQRWEPSTNSWRPMDVWLPDYGMRDPNIPSVPLIFDGRTNPNEVPDSIPGGNNMLRWRAIFSGAGCPTGYTSPVTMQHYGFTQGEAEHTAVANGATARMMPDWFMYPGVQDNNLCERGGPLALARGTPPAEWMDYIRATKLPDCRWQVSLSLQGPVVTHPYLDYVSMRFDVLDGEHTRIMYHRPGIPLRTVITRQMPCDADHINVRLLLFFDEFDSTSLVNAANSCMGFPDVLDNFCLRDDVIYTGDQMPAAGIAECNVGRGTDQSLYSGGTHNGGPTPTPPTPETPARPPPAVVPTPTPTPRPVGAAPVPSPPTADEVSRGGSCLCAGFLANGQPVQCFADSTCFGGGTSGLGCYRDENNTACRFCGQDGQATCPAGEEEEGGGGGGGGGSGGGSPPSPVIHTPVPVASPTPATPTPPSGGGGGVYEDACVCEQYLPGGVKVQCFEDPECAARGGLGCFTYGGLPCRFCGHGDFNDCPSGGGSSGPPRTPVVSEPASTPPPETPGAPETPGGSSDACICTGTLPIGQTEQCFQDSSCARGGRGCYTDTAGTLCRFCGFLFYDNCP